jgi:protein-L-isoaspartate(D-aspartate) O-methyltransferase
MPDKENLLEQLRQEGFSEEIINAFGKVNREDFVSAPYAGEAYQNTALPIGYDQTISQPSTIAFMLEKSELKDGQKVLEVGSGSGYVLALMAEIIKEGEIYGTERVEELYDMARHRLKDIPNIKVFYTPAGIGLAEKAPFDRILVSAAADQSIPQALFDQLKKGGIIVCPVANSIIKAKKGEDGIISAENYPGFAFVPLMTE